MGGWELRGGEGEGGGGCGGLGIERRGGGREMGWDGEKKDRDRFRRGCISNRGCMLTEGRGGG